MVAVGVDWIDAELKVGNLGIEAGHGAGLSRAEGTTPVWSPIGSAITVMEVSIVVEAPAVVVQLGVDRLLSVSVQAQMSGSVLGMELAPDQTRLKLMWVEQ